MMAAETVRRRRTTRGRGIGARRLAAILALAVLAAACGGEREGAGGGAIIVDGSSTVYPLTEAVAEEFGIAQGGATEVTVGLSGTGGGFQRFCAGETDISNASRPIDDAEREQCMINGVRFLELPVAYDGLSVVVHPDNTWVDCLTVQELRRIWEPGSTVRSWADVREGFPEQPLRLYGPGTDSGTFDYFTEAIVGEPGASRPDYTQSEDDNVLVTGVAGDPGALGYFGYAYYSANRARVKLLGVDAGNGCVQPTPETIRRGTYAPLSRPLFIYVNRESLARPEVAAFVRFYMESAPQLAAEVGYVPLGEPDYQANLQRIAEASR
ncbi:MAG TPA: PstS family phosphate ABC transporter substrate-binding protein [Longimicrobiales bacterium]